jgi:hypothetical protein
MAENTQAGMQIAMGTEATANVPAVAAPNLPANIGEGSWGGEGVSASDILLPKILLMQGLSKAVADEKAKAGDMLDSLSGSVIGSKSDSLEILAFNSFKTWIVYEQVPGKGAGEGAKLKFIKQEPMTPQNESWPLEEMMNGVQVRRDKALNFYCLLTSQVAKGEFMPYLLSCRRTSYPAGRKLVTHFARLKMFNKPPASRIFELTCKKQENDKGVFYVFDVAEKRPSTDAEMQAAYQWWKVIQSTQVRVDDSDLAEDGAPVGAPVDPDAAATRSF